MYKCRLVSVSYTHLDVYKRQLVYNGNPGPAGEYATEVFNQVDERLLTAQAMTTVEIAEALGRGPLKFHPGTSWLYGTSADVLGAVIEAASGMTFGAFLEKNLFGPLGMKDTGFFVPEEKKGRLAAAYRLDENGEMVRYEENHLGIINDMAVSYTHLDVYKRQSQDHGLSLKVQRLSSG